MNKKRLLKRLETIHNNCGDCFYLSRNTQCGCYNKIGQLIKDIKVGKFDGAIKGTAKMTDPFNEEQ